MASNSEAVKKSIVFIWGQMGEKLKDIDQDRMIACMEKNPNITLYNIFREKIRPILNRIRDNHENSNPGGVSIGRDDLKNEIEKANKFREISKFMRDELDELSMGSALLGEIKSPEAEQDDIFVDDDEITE